MNFLQKYAPAAAAALLTMVLFAGPSFGYEFHLLGGMVIEGDLKSFSSGVFYVDTEFGEMTLNAANLDYIIVEETDASGPRGVYEGMLEFGLPERPKPPEPEDWSPERVEVPGALAGYSIQQDKSAYKGTFMGSAGAAAPNPLGSWSAGSGVTRQKYPGTLRGDAGKAAPDPLGSWSAGSETPEPKSPCAYGGDEGTAAPSAPQGSSAGPEDEEGEMPRELAITADDYAGAYLDLEGTSLPDPFEGYSLDGEEEPPAGGETAPAQDQDEPED